jgi:hypothetical protein
MITIIDYNLGNVGSIKNMIEFLGYTDVEISSNHERILSSSHLILPGVGSFDQGMLNLNSLGLDLIIKKYALNLKKPLLDDNDKEFLREFAEEDNLVLNSEAFLRFYHDDGLGHLIKNVEFWVNDTFKVLNSFNK